MLRPLANAPRRPQVTDSVTASHLAGCQRARRVPLCQSSSTIAASQAHAAHAGVGAPAAATLHDAAAATAAHARALHSSLMSVLHPAVLRARAAVQPAAVRALAALRSGCAGAARLLDPAPNPSVWPAPAPARAGAESAAGAQERPARGTAAAARQAVAAWLSRFGRCFRTL